MTLATIDKTTVLLMIGSEECECQVEYSTSPYMKATLTDPEEGGLIIESVTFGGIEIEPTYKQLKEIEEEIAEHINTY